MQAPAPQIAWWRRALQKGGHRYRVTAMVKAMAKKRRTRAAETAPVSPRAQALRRARRMVGLTQTALADKIGVTPGAVSAWENGARVPSDNLIPVYAAALGLTPGALLDILDMKP